MNCPKCTRTFLIGPDFVMDVVATGRIRTVSFTRGLPGVLRGMHAASPGILTDMASEATKKIILGG